MPAVNASGISDYSYVKSVAVTGSPDGSLTDYPVRFVIHPGAGPDSGVNVYLNGHSKSWPDDIRFTNNNDVPLSYWIESSDGDSAIVWVKADYLPVSPGSSIIKLYYGRAFDPGASSGESTFLLFDDFSGDWLDSGIWSGIAAGHGASIKQYNGVLRLIGGGMNESRPLVMSNDKFGPGIMITARERTYNSDSISAVVLSWDGYTGGPWNSPNNAYSLEYSPPAHKYSLVKTVNGIPSSSSDRTMLGDYDMHVISLGLDRNGAIQGWVDGALVATATDLAYKRGNVGLYGREQPSGVSEEFDYVYVRNWTINEPYPGTWGAETSAQSGILGVPIWVLLALMLALVIILLLIFTIFILTVFVLGRK